MVDRVFVVGDLKTAAAQGCGLMAPRVGIAAHMQANVVVQLLLGEYEPSRGRTAIGLYSAADDSGIG